MYNVPLFSAPLRRHGPMRFLQREDQYVWLGAQPYLKFKNSSCETPEQFQVAIASLGDLELDFTTGRRSGL